MHFPDVRGTIEFLYKTVDINLDLDFCSKLLCIIPSMVTPGCDRGRSQRVGPLFRWVGQDSSGLLSGGSAHGPLLPHHQGLHGNTATIKTFYVEKGKHDEDFSSIFIAFRY